MNWVDIVIILIIAQFVVRGYFKGFLGQLISLAAIAFSFIGAIELYPWLLERLDGSFSLPPSLTGMVIFVGTWAVLQAAFLFVALKAYRLVPRWLRAARLNRLAGMLPALAEGLLVAVLILSLFLVLPLPQGAQDDIRSSRLGGALLDRSHGIEAFLEQQFGGAVDEVATLLTPKPQSHEVTELDFTTDKLGIDEASELRMLELINQERLAQGLNALIMDEELRQVARAHSADMFRRGYFSHYSRDGRSPFDRLRDAGISFGIAGENLALAPDVETAHTGLMNSPGHRANILEPRFNKVGIGVIDGGIYGKMFSQEFSD